MTESFVLIKERFTMSELRESLKIETERVDEINEFLLNPDNELVNDLLEIVERYGGPQEINRKAAEARSLDHLMYQLKSQNSSYVNLSYANPTIEEKNLWKLPKKFPILQPSTRVENRTGKLLWSTHQISWITFCQKPKLLIND